MSVSPGDETLWQVALARLDWNQSTLASAVNAIVAPEER